MMKQYRMEQLQNGCWCVWRNGGAVNAAVPTMVEAELLVNTLKEFLEFQIIILKTSFSI